MVWPNRLPAVVLLLLLGSFLGLYWIPFVLTLPAAVLLFIMLARLRPGRLVSAPEPAFILVLARVLVVVPAAGSATMIAAQYEWQGVPSVLPLVLGAVCLAVAALVAYAPRVFWCYLAAQGVVLTLTAYGTARISDVSLFAEGAASALAEGTNPYSISIKNLYDAEQTALFWSPEFIDGDRIMIGFPYLPSTLLPMVPAHLIGEVRWAMVAALLGTSAVLFRLATEPVGRLVAAALPVSPLALRAIINYYVEPLLLFFLVVLVWAMVRRRGGWGAVGLALLLAGKQYLVVLLPLERLVRRRLGLRWLLVGAGAAAALILGFFAMDPEGFWVSVVAVQFSQPFRADSTSLAVHIVNLGVPVAPWVLSIGSLAAGLAVAFWVRLRAPSGATWLALGMALSMLAMVLLSKQAFANYYMLIQGCLMAAVVVWPHELGAPIPDGESQEPRPAPAA